MKPEITVSEVTEIFKGIQQRPEQLFEIIRMDIKEVVDDTEISIPINATIQLLSYINDYSGAQEQYSSKYKKIMSIFTTCFLTLLGVYKHGIIPNLRLLNNLNLILYNYNVNLYSGVPVLSSSKSLSADQNSFIKKRIVKTSTSTTKVKKNNGSALLVYYFYKQSNTNNVKINV